MPRWSAWTQQPLKRDGWLNQDFLAPPWRVSQGRIHRSGGVHQAWKNLSGQCLFSSMLDRIAASGNTVTRDFRACFVRLPKRPSRGGRGSAPRTHRTRCPASGG